MGKTLVVVALGVALAVGCSTGPSEPPRVPEASEQEHRLLAEEHAKKADAEASKYNPQATVTKSRGPVPGQAELGRVEREVNPTDKHLRRARRERALAEAHANAARHIDAFADAACAPIAPGERASCPLFLDARVEDIPGGVRIHVDDVEDTVAHVRCQLAFAKKLDNTGGGQCPLFVPGARVATAGGDAFDLVTDRAELVTELRRRAREHALE